MNSNDNNTNSNMNPNEIGNNPIQNGLPTLPPMDENMMPNNMVPNEVGNMPIQNGLPTPPPMNDGMMSNNMGPTGVENVPTQNTVPTPPPMNGSFVGNNIPNPNTVLEQPQPMYGMGTQPDLNQNTKKKSSPIAIIVLVVALGALGYFLYNKFVGGGGSAECIKDIKVDIWSIDEDNAVIASGKTQYVFDKKIDNDLVKYALESDDIALNICYKNAKDSLVQFYLGESTETKSVESFELYNRKTNEKIKSNTIDDLFVELGYPSIGKHTEEVTIVDVYSTMGFEIGDSTNTTFTSYTFKITLANGNTIEAIYKAYTGQEDKAKQVVQGNRYTIDYEVGKDSFGSYEYVITDFK